MNSLPNLFNAGLDLNNNESIKLYTKNLVDCGKDCNFTEANTLYITLKNKDKESILERKEFEIYPLATSIPSPTPNPGDAVKPDKALTEAIKALGSANLSTKKVVRVLARELNLISCYPSFENSSTECRGNEDLLLCLSKVDLSIAPTTADNKVIPKPKKIKTLI